MSSKNQQRKLKRQNSDRKDSISSRTNKMDAKRGQRLESAKARLETGRSWIPSKNMFLTNCRFRETIFCNHNHVWNIARHDCLMYIPIEKDEAPAWVPPPVKKIKLKTPPKKIKVKTPPKIKTPPRKKTPPKKMKTPPKKEKILDYWPYSYKFNASQCPRCVEQNQRNGWDCTKCTCSNRQSGDPFVSCICRRCKQNAGKCKCKNSVRHICDITKTGPTTSWKAPVTPPRQRTPTPPRPRTPTPREITPEPTPEPTPRTPTPEPTPREKIPVVKHQPVWIQYIHDNNILFRTSMSEKVKAKLQIGKSCFEVQSEAREKHRKRQQLYGSNGLSDLGAQRSTVQMLRSYYNNNNSEASLHNPSIRQQSCNAQNAKGNKHKRSVSGFSSNYIGSTKMDNWTKDERKYIHLNDKGYHPGYIFREVKDGAASEHKAIDCYSNTFHHSLTRQKYMSGQRPMSTRPFAPATSASGKAYAKVKMIRPRSAALGETRLQPHPQLYKEDQITGSSIFNHSIYM